MKFLKRIVNININDNNSPPFILSFLISWERKWKRTDDPTSFSFALLTCFVFLFYLFLFFFCFWNCVLNIMPQSYTLFTLEEAFYPPEDKHSTDAILRLAFFVLSFLRISFQRNSFWSPSDYRVSIYRYFSNIILYWITRKVCSLLFVLPFFFFYRFLALTLSLLNNK